MGWREALRFISFPALAAAMGWKRWAGAWKAAVVLASVGPAAWATWTISAHQAQSTLRAENQVSYRAERTADDIQRACALLEGEALAECVAVEIEASREDQRAEYNLSAQERMAEWALWMVFVSAVTMALTAVAVWYVKLTLDATRDAVREAGEATKAAKRTVAVTRRASERQLRPWMLFDSIEPEQQPDGSYTIRVIWKNFGTSPAGEVEILTRWGFYAPHDVPPIKDVAEADGTSVMVGIIAPGGRGPNPLEPISFQELWGYRVSLTSRCRYRDFATGKQHESMVSLACWQRGKPHDQLWSMRWIWLAPDTAN